MKLPWLIFALLVAMCGSVGTVMLTPEPTIITTDSSESIDAGHGIPHPRIATMLNGGDGWQRYQPIRIAVWVFAICMICFFTSLLVLASRRDGRPSPMMGWLWAACAVHLFSMVGMLVSYESYANDPQPRLFGAFPAPTAWMLYVLWPAPLVFVMLYVFRFRRWTFGPEDEQAFAELVRDNSARPGVAEDTQ